jgi:hypothetical protein
MTVNAQTSIGTFYGLELGQSMASVESTLRNKGLTYTEKVSDIQEYKGYPLIQVTKAKLGSVTFERLNLVFVENKLVWGGFVSFVRGEYATWHNMYSVHMNTFNDLSSKYEKEYYETKMNLISKYGSPQVNNDAMAIWRQGRYQITIYYEYNKNIDANSAHVNSRVGVEYSLIDLSDM